MGMLRQFFVILVLVCLGAAAWHLGKPDEIANDGNRTQRNDTITAIAQSVGTASERIRLEAVGTARAMRSVTLHPETAGEVAAVNFTADSLVEQGQVLLDLRQDAERLDVELARVMVADAQRTFERLEKLSKTGTSTQVALDEARTALQSARIELRQAEVALSKRSVRAPFAGHIGLSDIEPGDRIDSDTMIASLDDRSSLLIRFDVPEALLGRIEPGSVIQVSSWNDSRAADGIVVDVDSRIDSTTRTFPVRAEIDNADDRFRPGMSFRVAMDILGRTWPTVPEIAIQWGGTGAYLWTIRDGKAERVGVRIIQRQEAAVLIDADIEPGEPVVVEGLHRMREGRPAEVTLRDNPVAAGNGS